MYIVYSSSGTIYFQGIGENESFWVSKNPSESPQTYYLKFRSSYRGTINIDSSADHQKILDRFNDIINAKASKLDIYDCREEVGYWKSN